MGNRASSLIKFFGTFRDQAFPPKPTFSVEQIPDLTGRVVIVTGTYRACSLYPIRLRIGFDSFGFQRREYWCWEGNSQSMPRQQACLFLMRNNPELI